MTLRKQATSALAWTWTNAALGAVFQFAITIVNARLLAPADFGLVAVAAVFIRFLAYFSQMGIAVAIVQRDKVHPHEVAGLVSVSVLIGGAFTAIGIVGAFFIKPDVAAVVRALSFSFLISSFSIVPIGLLRRELRYRWITLAELIGQLFGTGLTTVVLALLGAGTTALVVGSLVQQGLLAAITMWAASQYTGWFRLGRIGAESRSYLRYGITHSLNTFLEFIYFNAEVLVINHRFGVDSVGHYNRGMSLSHLPVEQATGSVTRVLFPLLSRVRGEPEKERTAFVAAFLFSGIFAASFSAALCASARDVTFVLLGARWVAAVPVIQVLAISVPLRYLYNMQSAALDAVGSLRPRTITVVACMLVKAVLAVVAIQAHASIGGLLAALILPDVLWQVVYLWLLPRRTPITARLLIQAYGIFLVCAAVSAAAVLGMAALARASNLPPILTFVAEVTGGGAIVVIAAVVVTRLQLLGLRAETLRGVPIFGRIARVSTRGRRD